jgi:hypothetical protein
MNQSELYKELKKQNIREDVYSLYGADIDERLVLNQLGNGKWEIYYFERGIKTGLRVYAEEQEACKDFLSILFNDPSAKKY